MFGKCCSNEGRFRAISIFIAQTSTLLLLSSSPSLLTASKKSYSQHFLSLCRPYPSSKDQPLEINIKRPPPLSPSPLYLHTHTRGSMNNVRKLSHRPFHQFKYRKQRRCRLKCFQRFSHRSRVGGGGCRMILIVVRRSAGEGVYANF